MSFKIIPVQTYYDKIDFNVSLQSTSNMTDWQGKKEGKRKLKHLSISRTERAILMK